MTGYKKLVGIYQIFCNANNKYYIGSSKSVKKRWAIHRYLLKRNEHTNEHLQNAYNKYGKDSMHYSIVEILPLDASVEEIERQETKWVLHFKSHEKEYGFNKTLPGSIPLKEEHQNTPLKERKKIICPVIVIEKSTGKTMEFDNSKEAEKVIGLSAKKINDCCLYWEGKPQSKKKGWKGWLFVRKSSYLSDFDYISHHRNKKPK